MNRLEIQDYISAVQSKYNDHTSEPKIVAVVDRWSLFKGALVL